MSRVPRNYNFIILNILFWPKADLGTLFLSPNNIKYDSKRILLGKHSIFYQL